jgi:hypothetical protein
MTAEEIAREAAEYGGLNARSEKALAYLFSRLITETRNAALDEAAQAVMAAMACETNAAQARIRAAIRALKCAPVPEPAPAGH